MFLKHDNTNLLGVDFNVFQDLILYWKVGKWA